MEEREGGPAAAFVPPAPRVSPSAGQRGGLQVTLQALLESLASSACGESASTGAPSSSPSPLVAARGVLCSAVAMRGEDSSSLFVLAFAAALVGAILYLTLLSVGRARR